MALETEDVSEICCEECGEPYYSVLCPACYAYIYNDTGLEFEDTF